MEIDKPVNLDEIQRYLLQSRKRGVAILGILGKLAPFLNAVLNTEVGREILKDDILRADELLVKIYDEEATDKERAEFRYLKEKRLPLIADRLREYLQRVEEVKKVNP